MGDLVVFLREPGVDTALPISYFFLATPGHLGQSPGFLSREWEVILLPRTIFPRLDVPAKPMTDTLRRSHENLEGHSFSAF